MITSNNPNLHRANDPDTSVHAANQQDADTRSELQRAIEAWSLGHELGFTDWELCAAEEFAGLAHSGLRTRRAELVAKGVLADSGWRRFPPGARNRKRLAVVWVHRIFKDRSNDNV